MLVQFSVTNYRSLRDKVTISMLAGTDKEHANDLIQADSKKYLVPTVAIYGANASGKSNMLMALKTMQDMITGTSAQLLKEKKLPYDPFVLSKNMQPLSTEFEIIFYYRSIKYAYSFSYDSNQIITEYLYHWPNGREALIFSRDNGNFEFRENVSEQNVLAGRTPANRLYLVSSNEWNAPQTELAYKWFAEKLLPYDEHNTPDFTSDMLYPKAEESGSLQAKIIQELMIADLGIIGVSCDKDLKTGKYTDIVFSHEYEYNGETDVEYLSLEQESTGTQRFFARIGPWIEALEKGGILFVDEIDASMHPSLTRRLVEMVQDLSINTNHAQLIFTTHDAMLLDLTLLRRDQVWFTEKDPKSLATDLFSLWDFSVRKGENIRKGYLQGRFGAIPFIGGDAQWQE